MKSYTQSLAMLERALKSIPVGAQTFSKSHYCFPINGSPLFLQKGKGAIVWDYDGNEYVDFISALLAINLGYSDEDVNQAVIQQVIDGSVFSLPHQLEAEVAELIIQHIPCAEKVRFAKNGSDATSAAIRIARAYTGKTDIAACGYHGWHDWYIGSTARSIGVPAVVQQMTHKFEFNNIQSLADLLASNSNIAAVILEPMNVDFPNPDFLPKVRELCDQYQVLMVFDETITGFRFAPGSAQAMFGVTPDLTALGKGLANGFPLSAICGKACYMDLMDEIFFSGTFAGDVIALAAAKACIEKSFRLGVTQYLENIGNYLIDGLQTILQKHQLTELFSVKGHPSWSFLIIHADKTQYSDEQITSYIMQEMSERGMLFFGSHNLNFSHTQAHIDQLLACYQEILPRVQQAIRENNLLELLHCEPIKPIFRVRKKKN